MKARVNWEKPLMTGGALHAAAYYGHSEIVKILIKHGSLVDEVDSYSGATPLHFAVGWGWYAAADVLLQNGANHTIAASSGLTAVHLAAHTGNLSMMKLLERHGASIFLRTSNIGNFPLRNALVNKHFEMAQYPIEKGSPLMTPDVTGWTDAMIIAILTENEDPMWKNLLTNEQWDEAIREVNKLSSRTAG